MEVEPKLPHVAVIITTHNYGKWLPDAIASVILQDYPNKSIYIYDDASTDNTLDIFNELLEKQPKKEVAPNEIEKETWVGQIRDVKIYAQTATNRTAQGPSFGRNQLIMAAQNTADIFAILDADDYWLQGKLSESVVKIMENPEKIGAVYTDTIILNIHDGGTHREFRESFDFNRLLRNNMVHSGCVINKLALQKVGVYDETMRVAEDYDLWIRIAEKFMIYHIPKPLVTIRTGSYNSTNTVPKETWNKCWAYINHKMQTRHKKNA